jgi:hypothetical protein
VRGVRMCVFGDIYVDKMRLQTVAFCFFSKANRSVFAAARSQKSRDRRLKEKYHHNAAASKKKRQFSFF